MFYIPHVGKNTLRAMIIVYCNLEEDRSQTLDDVVLLFKTKVYIICYKSVKVLKALW